MNFPLNHRTALRTGRLKVLKNVETAFRIGAWFAALNGHVEAIEYCVDHEIEIKAANATIGPKGGFLVSTEVEQAIIDLREEYGVFRAAARVVQMASGMVDVPRRDGGITAYFVDEAQAITESQAAWGSVDLTAKKLAILTRSSSELDEDTLIELGEWFVKEMAWAFAVKEDQCGWNGDGTSTFGGMRGICPVLLDGNHAAGKVVAASGHDTFAEIDLADLTNLISKLPAVAIPGARWFCSQLCFALTICRLASSTGGIVMKEVEGRLLPHFMGFPVMLTQALPQVATDLSGSVMLAFGDLSQAATLGERRGITILKSEERFLEFDQTAWRGTERVDINCHSLGDATTTGPIVGLVGE